MIGSCQRQQQPEHRDCPSAVRRCRDTIWRRRRGSQHGTISGLMTAAHGRSPADSTSFRPFHAWITALAGLAFLGNGLDLALVSFSLPGMRAEFGLSPAEVGYILPMGGIGQLLGFHRGRRARRPDRTPAGVRPERLPGGTRHRARSAGAQPGRLRHPAVDRRYGNRRGSTGRQRTAQRACAAGVSRVG